MLLVLLSLSPMTKIPRFQWKFPCSISRRMEMLRKGIKSVPGLAGSSKTIAATLKPFQIISSCPTNELLLPQLAEISKAE